MLDCLIIGGGSAGLLAALYLGRYCRTVRVIRAAKIPKATITLASPESADPSCSAD
jgi:thioredoxin reductase